MLLRRDSSKSVGFLELSGQLMDVTFNKKSIRIPSVLSESFEKSFHNLTGNEQLSNCLRMEK